MKKTIIILAVYFTPCLMALVGGISSSLRSLGGASCSAQNVGISATGVNPHNSAMLDVVSNTKGILIPRMTGDEKYAIPSPATGLLIFQTPDTAGYWYYNGTKWISLLSSTSSTSGSTGGWGLSGNSSTTASNFLGTTDNVSLRMRTNDTTRVIVDSLGRVGIGKTNPAYKLDILDSNSAGSGAQSITLNNYQIRTEANITAVTSAIGIKSHLLYHMTEGTPGTQGDGIGSRNSASTDGEYTFRQLIGAYNYATTYSTATANQNFLSGASNVGSLNSSGTLTSAYGGYNVAYNNSSGTITNAYGSGSRVYTNSTGNITYAQGALNSVFTNTGASGIITNAYGSNNSVQNLSTSGGSIAKAVGVQSYISKAATASAIGTGYLYYGSYGSGAATTPWGIYLSGEDKNYFSGKVGIGTETPVANAKLAIKDGHLQSQQTTAPSITGAVTYSTYSLSNATDVAGKISITTTAAAGSVTVTFDKAYTVAPVVILTPTNAASATDIAKVYVTSATTTFTVNFSASPAAGVHTYNYQVIETQ